MDSGISVYPQIVRKWYICTCIIFFLENEIVIFNQILQEVWNIKNWLGITDLQ